MSTALVRTAANRGRANLGPAHLRPRRSSRVVIVGGGAGGLELAIRLAKLTRPGDRARVTLIDRRPTHIWKPRLHEIAAGLLVAAQEEAGHAAPTTRRDDRTPINHPRPNCTLAAQGRPEMTKRR